MRISRIIVMLLGLLFAGVGLEFWLAPEQAAGRFHVAAVGVFGLSSLRADFGGLFVGMALLCLAGAWTRRRTLLVAAALVLAAVAVGRLIGLAAHGRAATDFASLGIEALAIATLLLCTRFKTFLPG